MKKIQKVIGNMIFFIVGFVILFSVFWNSFKNSNFSRLNDIFANWEENRPFTVIQELTNGDCSTLGMKNILEFDLFFKEICVCQNKFNSFSKCKENEIQKGCIDLQSKTEINKFWKNKLICGSNGNFKKYFDLIIVEKNEDCPNSFKKCGIIDTLGNFLCISKNEICPVNNLKVSSKNDDSSINLFSDNLNVNEGRISTKIEIFEKNQNLKRNQIELSDPKNPINEEEFENFMKNVQFLDKIQKVKFFKRFIPFINENVIDENDDIYLISSNYIGWNKNCFKKEFKNFKNNDNGLKEIALIEDLINSKEESLINIGHLLLIPFSSVFLLKYLKKDLKNFFQYFFLICMIPLKIYLIILTNNVLNSFKTLKYSINFFDFVSKNECSDFVTNQTLNQLSSLFFQQTDRYFNIHLFSFLGIIIAVIQILILYFSKIKEKKNKKIEKVYRFY